MPLHVQAQTPHSDWLRHAFSDDSAHIYRYRPVQLLIALDFRQTYIGTPHNEDIPISLRGIKVGLIIHDRHRTGLGYSVIHNANLNDHTGAPIHLKYHAFSVFYEYYYLDTRHWSLGTPVEVGIGRYTVEGQDPLLNGKTNNITAAGIALDLHYRPIRWIGLSVMGGYRYAFNDGPVDLNNWFYSLGISSPLGYVAQDIRYHHRKNKLRRDLKHNEGMGN
jgi:hypothetical protein